MKKTLLSIFMFIAPTIMMAQGWPSDYKGVMLQGFYWDSYSETSWTKLTEQAGELSQYFNLIWVPQSGWCNGTTQMGYSPIYWYDQHSGFGSEEELKTMINTYKAKNVGIIADVVINHRNGATRWTDFPTETNPLDGKSYLMGLSDICSDDEYNTDAGAATERATYGNATGAKDTGEGWSGMRDLDHTSANVQTNIEAYTKFLKDYIGYAGFRYDYCKGFAGKYIGIYNNYAQPTYSVGEYWDGNAATVETWLKATKYGDDIESAAFDFPQKYLMNNNQTYVGKWFNKTGSLCNDETFKRYSVTFVDNHDSYRDANKFTGDVCEANAWIIALPGTPCVFYQHWKDHKGEIGSMIKLRNAVGITNTSKCTLLAGSSSTTYCVAETEGDAGKSLIVIVGDITSGEKAVDLTGYTKATNGNKYAYYVKGVSSVLSVDKPSGTYDNTVSVIVKALGGGTIVYTTDGTEPTATNGKQVSDAVSLTFTATTTLKAGILLNGTVTDVETYTYTISTFAQHDITVYVKDPGWTAMYFHTWGDYRTGTSWPGTMIVGTKTINGAKWYYNTYTITRSDDYVNFVFNQGSNAKQTVDVDNVTKDSYFEISTSADSQGHYYVNDVTSTVTGINDIRAEKASDEYWYSLSGVRYKGRPSARGIYVHGGKKIVLR